MTHTAFQLLPTCRPLLPEASAILPFLEEIDARRWYSNFGPLVQRFEARLAEHFEAETGSVVTVSSATAGLTLALREATGDRDGLCLMPAWTFVATPIAARNAGLTPFFADVDPDSWQLTPDRARALVATLGGRVEAVMPVAPFGAPVDVAAWADFAEETGIPVIVDGAAAFDTSVTHPRVVTVVSLHATKVLGVGDGGFVLAGDAARADRLRRMSNFGMNAARCAVLPGTNAKMSEYTAAVGLAALSRWPRTRRRLLESADDLAATIAGFDGPAPRKAARFASATFNVRTRDGGADRLIAWLKRCGLEARKWWGEGCHRHPALADLPREALPVTDALAASIVALPFWIDMTPADRDIVASCLLRYRP